MPSERRSNRPGSEAGDKNEVNKHLRQLQDPMPHETLLASDTKAEVFDASYVSNSKVGDHDERTKASDPTTIPRSHSYFQHDDRATAAQDGRRSGRRVTSERGSWKDSKHDERAARKAAGSDIHEKEGKPHARGGDTRVWRHDRFSELEPDPPAKRRRPFREEKFPVEPESMKKAVPEQPSKISNPGISAMTSERHEERYRDRRPIERSENEQAYNRERPYLSSRGRAENVRFVSRDRGRDKFGGRQGYRSAGRVEKWKHDMFDEANQNATPETEEDPVAKVEALLAL